MIRFLFALLAVFTLSPNKASVYDIGNENWHLQSEAYMIVKDGKKLSSRKFDDYDWMKIGFPSTVVAAFVEAGECAEPVPGEEDFLAIPHHLVRGLFGIGHILRRRLAFGKLPYRRQCSGRFSYGYSARGWGGELYSGRLEHHLSY